jgi:hypothetical protein
MSQFIANLMAMLMLPILAKNRKEVKVTLKYLANLSFRKQGNE